MEKNNKNLIVVTARFTKDMLLKIYAIAEFSGLDYSSVDIAVDALGQAEKEISELYKLRERCESKNLISFNMDMSHYLSCEHTLIAIRESSDDVVKDVDSFSSVIGEDREILLAATIDTILDAKIEDLLAPTCEDRDGAFFEFDNELIERARQLKREEELVK